MMSSQMWNISTGLGRGLVETLLLRPNTRVIAAVRNPLDPNSQSLKSLPTATGSTIIIVQIDSSSEIDAFEAIQALRTEHGVTSLDVVIANAGISKFRGTALDTPIHEMKDHLMVNALGPLLLYQATKSLLDAASSPPKFIVISSVVSSITDVGKFPLPNTAYGTSKAALNFIIRKIHYENPKLIAFPIHPG
jgi:norsolorinic acid ketoreductase